MTTRFIATTTKADLDGTRWASVDGETFYSVTDHPESEDDWAAFEKMIKPKIHKDGSRTIQVGAARRWLIVHGATIEEPNVNI